MSIATRTGDKGTTGLMYGRRVSKNDSRVEAYGTVDELNSQLGMARATVPAPWVREDLFRIQKQLTVLMGELAVGADDVERYRQDNRFPKLTPEALAHLDGLVKKLEDQKIIFDGWATPGDSLGAASLDVARSVCRRAERLIVAIHEPDQLGSSLVIQFINRLSDVLWLLARYVETNYPSGGTPAAKG